MYLLNKQKNKGKLPLWSVEDQKFLLHKHANYTLDELATTLGRSTSSIRNKLIKMGVSLCNLKKS